MKEPAFPQPAGAIAAYGTPGHTQGMSLRDYFAAKFISVIDVEIALVCSSGDNLSKEQYAAQRAYQYADAMLAERDK